MINRILIRVKVVQMLYSYLLTKSDFSLLTYDAERATTNDTRFASRMAVAVLKMIVEMASDSKNAPRALKTSRLAASLAANEELKALLAKGGESADAFMECAPALREKLIDSALFAGYSHKRPADPFEADVTFWQDAVRLIFSKSPEFMAAATAMEGYTKVGFERGLVAVDDILGSYGMGRSQLSAARERLSASLNKAYELYHALLWLPVEITRAQDRAIDDARNKFLPTDADLSQSLRFVNNTLIPVLEKSEEMAQFKKNNPFDWTADLLFVDKLRRLVVASPVYEKYMAAEETPTPEQDVELWRELMKTVILPSEALAEMLEEQSVFWNDDIDIMGDFALKTLRIYATALAKHAKREKEDEAAEPRLELLPQYKDDIDAAFGLRLFNFAVEGRDYYQGLIRQFTSARRWEADRLAFMDVVVIIAALAEIVNFPEIPLAVSYNEYIEIAKSYSTARSGDFVNGILHSIVSHLQEERQLVK